MRTVPSLNKSEHELSVSPFLLPLPSCTVLGCLRPIPLQKYLFAHGSSVAGHASI